MRQDKLSLNTNKTEYMVIGHKRRINHIQGEKNVEMNGEKIQRAHEVKYLGVTIDEDLSLNKQYKRLKCLQHLQDRAQTLIEKAKFEDGWTCKWLSVLDLIKYDRDIMTYKMMNGLCPDNLRGKFITRSEISSYSTRNQLNIDIPRQNLEFSKGSFFHSGAKIWNEIPRNIRMSPTISMFKRNLKGFLQS